MVQVAGRWRLLYLKCRIWIGKNFFAQVVGKPKKGERAQRCSITNISPSACIKVTSDPNEIASMAFVRRNTTLPVPEIYGAWINPDRPSRCFLLMERMHGVTLENAWKSLGRRARKKLASELRVYMQELHAIPHPIQSEGHITSFIGGPIRDGALSVHSAKGPFASGHDFLNYLLLLVSDRDPLKRKYMELLGQNTQMQLQLTHGDLSPRNIIVDPQAVRITGIIDWTTCGWMPLYWERVKATFTSSNSAARVAFFDEAVGSWKEERDAVVDATSLDRGFR